MTILPLTYLGNTLWYSKFLQEECIVDIHENYIKQSYRNRCDLLAAGGPLSLTAPVVKGGSIHKKPLREMRLDYSKRWQHQHWLSFVSAYRNSPYFDHYESMFAPFYEKRFDFLFDFTYGLAETMLHALKIDKPIRLSDRYIVAGPEDCDLRDAFSPGTDLSQYVSLCQPARYWQVFAERSPFVPNLSVADLLFCEGPQSKEVLYNSWISR